jgi:hypothetical protein
MLFCYKAQRTKTILEAVVGGMAMNSVTEIHFLLVKGEKKTTRETFIMLELVVV